MTIPQEADVLREFGRLAAAGRYAELERLARTIADEHPDCGIAWKALGESQRRQGRDARQALQNAADLLPDDAEALSNLGAARRSFGQLGEAVAAYRRALEINPALAVVHGNLGNALRDLGRSDEAAASYRRALDLNPDQAATHNNLGNLLHDAGRLEDAVASYRHALRCDPSHADACSNLGSVLMHLGQTEEGEKTLGRAIELSPDAVRPLATALLFLPYRRDDMRFQRLEAMYAQRESLTAADRIRLGFAMGKAMEDVALYDRAFGAYEEANRLVHDTHPVDEAADDRHLDYVRSRFSRASFERWDAIAATMPVMRDEYIVPIFIVGMPRSGTSLIEQMLASHPAVHGAGELTQIGALADRARLARLDEAPDEAALVALRGLGREYLDQMATLTRGKRYVTDKLPGNHLYLWLIHLALPHAKIIHCMRDPLDTCFSCYALRFTSGHEYSYDLDTLGRKYVRYRSLMQHWRHALPAERLLDVGYEDTVADPEHEARRMLAHLGLPWDSACLRFHETRRAVRTASASQVRRPIYTSSVARWKHFERHLTPLLRYVRS